MPTAAIQGGLLGKGTLFYGIEQLLTAAISVGMLLELSTTAYAPIHPIVSWLVLAGCALLAWPLFRKELVVVRHAGSARLQHDPGQIAAVRSGVGGTVDLEQGVDVAVGRVAGAA